MIIIIQNLNLGNRAEIWQAGIRFIFEYPILGVGSGSLPVLIGTTAHNQYLTIFAELGIIGFILFFTFLIYLLREGIRAEIKGSPWVIIILGYMLILIFNDMAFITGMLLMGLVMSGASLDNLNQL